MSFSRANRPADRFPGVEQVIALESCDVADSAQQPQQEGECDDQKRNPNDDEAEPVEFADGLHVVLAARGVFADELDGEDRIGDGRPKGGGGHDP